ncbi:MAG: PIN domain-containing protein [Steroidobacteraceae bacterium]
MKKYLLDSSFIIDLLNEIADDNREGPALTWLRKKPKTRVWISAVTLAEVLEGAEDPEAVKAYLARYGWQGLHRAQAEKCALRQKRAASRMGENDAWQASAAECMKAIVLGHDSAFDRLGAGYEDHRKASTR